MANNLIAVIILTRNEARHITRALECIRAFASQVFIIDSYSTDNTCEIAKNMGAIVLQHEFVNYSKQFRWALDNAPINAEWVMRLDADEIIEMDLAAKISSGLSQVPSDVTGINLARKHVFLGRLIRYGGRYPLILLRIWRTGKAGIEDRWMDEHMVLTEGRAITFEGGFVDHNLNDLSYFTDKHNKYATREALDIIIQKRGLCARDKALNAQATSRQAAWKRFIKENIYNYIPFEIAVFGYFFYRYIILLGVLDGREGLAYHFLQGFWYRFLVGAKTRELEAALKGVDGLESVKRELSRLTGLKLDND